MSGLVTPTELSVEDQRLFFDEAASGIVVAAPDGAILRVNAAFCRFVARPAEWLLGRNLSDVSDPDEAPNPALRRELAAPVTVEKRYVRPDGTVVTALLTLGSARDAVGRHLVVGSLVDVTARANADARLRHYSVHDGLTGLPNRALFLDRLDQTLTRGEWGVCAVIGLDHFRHVNDALGRSAGDRVLVDFARRLEQLVGKNGTAARIGDDEFAVLAATTPRELEAIRHTLPHFHTSDGFALTASVGVREFEEGIAAEALLADAQLALHHAKASGRDRLVRYATTLRGQVSRAMLIERRLRRALDLGELDVHYQSIHRCEDGVLTGFEALARWNDAELGFVAPTEFIPVAEAHALIMPLGAYVLRQAVSQLARWRAAGHGDLTMSVNVSTLQLGDPVHVAALLAVLNERDVPAHLLKIELTESVFLDMSPDVTEGLMALSDTGVQLVLDDFGTGWSSFGYLLELPFKGLKVDRSFVTDIYSNPRRRGLVRAVADLARSLGMHCVGEGVENEAQRACLAELGVGLVQGWLYSRAIAPELVQFPAPEADDQLTHPGGPVPPPLGGTLPPRSG